MDDRKMERLADAVLETEAAEGLDRSTVRAVLTGLEQAGFAIVSAIPSSTSVFTTETPAPPGWG